MALVGLASAKRVKTPDSIRIFLVVPTGAEPLLGGFRRVPNAERYLHAYCDRNAAARSVFDTLCG